MFEVEWWTTFRQMRNRGISHSLASVIAELLVNNARCRSQQSLATECHISTRTVQRAITLARSLKICEVVYTNERSAAIAKQRKNDLRNRTNPR